MMQEVGLTPELRVRELIDLTASYYAVAVRPVHPAAEVPPNHGR
jgi:hypothetical protein